VHIDDLVAGKDNIREPAAGWDFVSSAGRAINPQLDMIGAVRIAVVLRAGD
jgi:hypothetical protein